MSSGGRLREKADQSSITRFTTNSDNPRSCGSSYLGTNAAGGTMPQVGWRMRTSASGPHGSISRRLILGWYHISSQPLRIASSTSTTGLGDSGIGRNGDRFAAQVAVAIGRRERRQHRKADLLAELVQRDQRCRGPGAENHDAAPEARREQKVQRLGHLAFRREVPEHDQIRMEVRERRGHLGDPSARPRDEAKLLQRIREERSDVRFTVNHAGSRRHVTFSKRRGIPLLSTRANHHTLSPVLSWAPPSAPLKSRHRELLDKNCGRSAAARTKATTMLAVNLDADS